MKKYTKLCLATLCFISSASALADGYKGEAPPLVPVSIPAFNGGFEFTLGALYMTPETTNTNFLGTRLILPSAFDGVNAFNARQDYAVNPNYNWGFVLGLGYVIPNTANDVKLDWMYFHNDYTSSEYLLGSSDTFRLSFIPTGSTTLGDSSTLHASGTVDYKFDAVDLTFGQYLNMGSRLQTRLFTGLRYMRLDDDLSTSYNVLDQVISSGTTTEYIDDNWSGQVNSSFNGLGPMVGIKADYYIGAGFGLSGAIDGALLVGQLSLDASNHFVSSTMTTGGVTTVRDIEDTNFDWDSQSVIAPGFDAKFGLNYKYQFNNGTLLGIELGYQVTKYIDVVEQVDFGTLGGSSMLAGQQSTGPLSGDVDVTNFRLAGPYLTVNVKI